MEKTTNILQNIFIYILLLLMPSVGYATQLSETVTSGAGESSNEDILAMVKKSRELVHSLIEKEKESNILNDNRDKMSYFIFKYERASFECTKEISSLEKEHSKLSNRVGFYIFSYIKLPLEIEFGWGYPDETYRLDRLDKLGKMIADKKRSLVEIKNELDKTIKNCEYYISKHKNLMLEMEKEKSEFYDISQKIKSSEDDIPQNYIDEMTRLDKKVYFLFKKKDFV